MRNEEGGVRSCPTPVAPSPRAGRGIFCAVWVYPGTVARAPLARACILKARGARQLRIKNWPAVGLCRPFRARRAELAMINGK